jgi:hypothetical protein
MLTLVSLGGFTLTDFGGSDLAGVAEGPSAADMYALKTKIKLATNTKRRFILSTSL